MKRNEMIEKLMSKASVNQEEAEKVLEECNWDLLDSIIYLERNGKVENNDITTIVEFNEDNEEQKSDSKKKEEKFSGIGEIIGRIFKFIGKFISKANNNYFEVRKENEKPVRISITISILLLIFLFIPTLVLLLIGLFCGYRYSLQGKSFNYDGVNNVFEEVSKSAETIKKDFKEGYEK